MDIGQLYDQTIATHYDQDAYGLLAGGRGLAFQQLDAHANGMTDVLDLAAGTGESLVAVRKRWPASRLSGIDVSKKMLDIARAKLAFRAIHDDVANAGRHVPTDSVDAILMHYLTTFVNGATVVAETAKLLRPGGCYSIVSTTFEAFPRLFQIGLKLLSEEAIRQMAPAPRDMAEVASYMSRAGLEVVAMGEFKKTLEFSDFATFYEFGLNSGFFTHIFTQCEPEDLASFARMDGVFPLVDEYRASVVLARKPL